MAQRLTSHAAVAALVVAFTSGSAVAQPGAKPTLTITASPDASQTVAGKTVLTFSAKVLQTGHDYRVELGSLWATEWKNPGTGVYSVVLPFTAKYEVPSSAKPGELCFSLTRRMGFSSTAIATKCRTVTMPAVNAGTQPAPTAGAAPSKRAPRGRRRAVE